MCDNKIIQSMYALIQSCMLSIYAYKGRSLYVFHIRTTKKLDIHFNFSTHRNESVYSLFFIFFFIFSLFQSHAVYSMGFTLSIHALILLAGSFAVQMCSLNLTGQPMFVFSTFWMKLNQTKNGKIVRIPAYRKHWGKK